MLLDRRGERAQLLPFGDAVHLAVALLPQIPQPLVVHLFVLGRGNKTDGGFRLVDGAIAVDLGAARLGLRARAQWFRGRLGMIETAAVAVDRIGLVVGEQLGVQHSRRGAHRLAPSVVGIVGCGLRGI